MSESGGKSSIMADWAQVVSALVGAVAAVVAGIAASQTFEQGKEQQAQASIIQTLQFFATFSGQSMLNIRDQLAAEDWCVRYQFVRDETYDQKVSLPQAVSFLDFFDAVQLCGQNGLCSDNFSHQLFRPYAQEYFKELSPLIVEQRGAGRGEAFGAGIAALAAADPESIQTPEAMAARFETECRVDTPAPSAPAQ